MGQFRFDTIAEAASVWHQLPAVCQEACQLWPDGEPVEAWVLEIPDEHNAEVAAVEPDLSVLPVAPPSLDDRVATLEERGSAIYAAISTAPSYPKRTWARVAQFTDIQQDLQGSSFASGVLTVGPGRAGWWDLSALGVLDNEDTDDLLDIRVNGASVLRSKSGGACVYALQEGDEVSVYCYSDKGSRFETGACFSAAYRRPL